jgi:4-hydroxy-3-methylbut-2-en-1-yl diphosphate synthase IspG/GcpE
MGMKIWNSSIKPHLESCRPPELGSPKRIYFLSILRPHAVDLQETTANIRQRTAHLKGMKIGIMGCIVNGPGEMADADYGYVGSGEGVISLYKGKEVVRRNIPTSNAVDELIDLIKEHDDWVEVGAE